MSIRLFLYCRLPLWWMKVKSFPTPTTIAQQPPAEPWSHSPLPRPPHPIVSHGAFGGGLKKSRPTIDTSHDSSAAGKLLVPVTSSTPNLKNRDVTRWCLMLHKMLWDVSVKGVLFCLCCIPQKQRNWYGAKRIFKLPCDDLQNINDS
jgi:ABC-type glycerol-3-phosphate transport system permease component